MVRQYTEPAIDAEALLNAYVDRRATAIAPNLEAPFRQFDVAKYAFALQRLQAMLANETGTLEAQWQLEIVEIILLLNPRYIKAFTEVRHLGCRRIDMAAHRHPVGRCVRQCRRHRDQEVDGQTHPVRRDRGLDLCAKSAKPSAPGYSPAP